MHGHGLGASGAIEMVACIHAVRDGIIAPPSTSRTPTRVSTSTSSRTTPRERAVQYAMNNTFGFGGHNVTPIVGRYRG